MADAEALGDAMQRFAGRIVHRLNRRMRRTGTLFDERYHDRPLTTPREVKNALRHVINNARRHGAQHGMFFHPSWIDLYSSALWFDGWGDPDEIGNRADVVWRRATAEPKTWLRLAEIPGGADCRAANVRGTLPKAR